MAPKIRITIIESQNGRLIVTIMTPEVAPMNAASDPTERSIWKATMTRSIPTAKIRM